MSGTASLHDSPVMPYCIKGINSYFFKHSLRQQHFIWSQEPFVLKQAENPSAVWICLISCVLSEEEFMIPIDFALLFTSTNFIIKKASWKVLQ
jgi:hypothetical protein